MDAFAWFWLTVIVGIITIGVNDALCTYWKYKYVSNKIGRASCRERV